MDMQTDKTYQRFGKLIKELRNDMHMTQDDLADKVGLSRASIANIESGRQKIYLHQLFVFSKFLNVAPTDLLPETDFFEQESTPLNLISKNDEAWVSAILEQAKNA